MSHDPTSCPTPEQLLELYPVFAELPYASGFNVWSVDVVGAGAGVYIISILSVPYIYVSDGTEPDATALRDAILAVLDAAEPSGVSWVAVASGLTAISITSAIDGSALGVTSNLGPTSTELELDEVTPLTPGEIMHQATDFAACLVCDWGCSTWSACVAAAVHWLKMWGQGQSTTGGPSGAVVSMTQGPFSVSFAQSQFSSGSDGWWAGTPEGAQFLFLRRQQGPRPIALRGGASCFPVSRAGTARRTFV